MKKTTPEWKLLLILIYFPIVLLAQDADLFPAHPPDLDTLHYPIWPGCYNPDSSEQAQYRCTCKKMAALIYPNVNWPSEALIDSAYIKILIHVNQNGTLSDFQLFRKTNHWLDSEVLKTMRELIPSSNWRPAYLFGQVVNAEFAAWIRYKPRDAGSQKVVLTSLEKSTPLQVGSNIFHYKDYLPTFDHHPAGIWGYLQEQVKMPSILKDELLDNLLIIQFVVGWEGKVHSPKVVKSAHPEIDAAYLQAFKKMPNWLPGRRYPRTTNGWRMELPIRIQFK